MFEILVFSFSGLFISFVLGLYIIKRSEIRGFCFEQQIKFYMSFNNPNGYEIHNFIFEVDGQSVQIDHLIITSHGIFVIEAKNYSGIIYGNADATYWNQGFKNIKGTYSFYSPLLQNKRHIERLQKLLPVNIKFESLVVFNNSVDLDIFHKNVIKFKELKNYISLYKDVNLTDLEKKQLFNRLNEIRKKQRLTLKTHLDNIQPEYLRCPLCGKKLFIRKSNFGQFYGCSGYPDCNYTRSIDSV